MKIPDDDDSVNGRGLATPTLATDSEVSQLSLSQVDEFPIGSFPFCVFSFVLEAASALGVDCAMGCRALLGHSRGLYR
jgi:hypothetical protein